MIDEAEQADAQGDNLLLNAFMIEVDNAYNRAYECLQMGVKIAQFVDWTCKIFHIIQNIVL